MVRTMEEEKRFGYMSDLVLALRRHGVPIIALDFSCFTPRELGWITDAYSIVSIQELERACDGLQTESV